jgi:CHASE2 domain-containing sensor protein
MAKWVTKQLDALRKKKLWYWLRAVAAVILGVWLGDQLTESNLWLEQRRTTYRLLHKLKPRKPHPKWVTLVLIEDNDYWLGQPAGRQPTRRDYLADLMRAAAAANPRLVALDFSLRSPSPEGNPINHLEYKAETEKLVDAIAEIAKKCPVVISKALGPEENDGFTVDSDVYDGHDFGDASVLKGYIALPFDERLVPTAPVQLQNGSRLDSFAGAIVRAVHPEMLSKERDAEETLPYGDFMNLEQFNRVAAEDVLRNVPSAVAALAHRLVIIGGHWRTEAVDRWDYIDLHGSPNGNMPGIALHANYVEAILDSRVYPGWSPLALHIVEGIGAALVVVVFTLEIGAMSKALAVAGVALILVALSAFSLLAFGLVLDFFVPVVGAIGHGLFEQVLDWRDKARAHDASNVPPEVHDDVIDSSQPL